MVGSFREKGGDQTREGGFLRENGGDRARRLSITRMSPFAEGGCRISRPSLRKTRSLTTSSTAMQAVVPYCRAAPNPRGTGGRKLWQRKK